MKFIAYFRVSTQKQRVSGLGLEAQQAAVAGFTAGQGDLIASYTEIESGRKNDRPELARALAACKKHGATLVVAKLDRLARNVAFISNLMESRADFVAVDFPQANRLTLHILAAIAEHEREMVSARTKAALAAARARGTRLGNPRLWQDSTLSRSAGQALAAKAQAHAEDLRPVLKQIAAAGISTYAGIAAALNARGIRTRRGGDWHASTARRLVLRMG